MKASGSTAYATVWVSNDGLMALSTKVNGSSARQMVTANCIMLMVTSMKETGLTTKQMEKEHTHMPTVQNT